MDKDTALDLALEALEGMNILFSPLSRDCTQYNAVDRARKAITAIKQARALDKKADHARELGLDYEPVLKDNSNYRLDPPVAEPVAWKWHQAPVKTSWGHDMVVADLAIDKDNTVSVYCERDQTTKVEAMFTPPAQPAPDLQAELEATNRQVEILSDALAESRREVAQLKSQPAPLQKPLTDKHIERIYHRYGGNMINCARAIERAVSAAQRQWVGLTLQERNELCRAVAASTHQVRAIEAKLKEKNT